MVSEGDVSVLSGFYDALKAADPDAAIELCDEEVEVYMPPYVVAATAPRGRRDVGEYLRGWFQSWDMYRPEPEDFVASGEQVVALVHLRARGKNSRFDIEEDTADIYQVEDGKISKLRLYVERQAAFAQADPT